MGLCHGASLTAPLSRLGERKGLALVDCDSTAVNAFFVRRDCLKRGIPTSTPHAAYRPNLRRLKRGLSLRDQYDLIKHMPFQVVDPLGVVGGCERS